MLNEATIVFCNPPIGMYGAFTSGSAFIPPPKDLSVSCVTQHPCLFVLGMPLLCKRG